jgi:Flp pilus assembly protein TadG
MSRGQGLVEMALITPLAVVCLFGIVEMGRLFHAWVTIQHAARTAARVAVTGQGEEDGTRLTRIITAAQNAATGLSGNAPIISVRSYAGVTTSGGARDNNPGSPCDLVEVIVRYTYRPVVPLIGSIMPNNGELQLEGQDRKLNEPWIPCP